MKIGKLVVGAILLLIGLWMIFTLDNTVARWVGGGIVIILGVAQLAMGYRGGDNKPAQPVQQAEQPEEAETPEQQ